MKLSELPAETLGKMAHLVGDDGSVELPVPTGYNVLVWQYVRGEKSKGGVFFSDATKQEDVYQGRYAVVLALGTDAYTDNAKFPKGEWVKPGDWVLLPAALAAVNRFRYGKSLVLATVTDDAILATGIDPERIELS